jgi:hypothetical protein
MTPPAEHRESEILLDALDLVAFLVEWLDSRDPSILDDFEADQRDVSRGTD